METSREKPPTAQLLESALGLKFRDRELLQQALVHGSLVHEQGGEPEDSNERLEFLGDVVLELAVSTLLFRRFPHIDEGDLTQLRVSLVRRETLARVARHLHLGDFILLGEGAAATGGRQQDTILAAAFEAVAAAVYLDQGYEEASRFVVQSLELELAQMSPHGIPPDNPKSGLQEFIQSFGKAPPQYQLVSKEGPDHCPLFTVDVLIDEEVVGTGQGGKRSDAEKSAARDALSRSFTMPWPREDQQTPINSS